MPAIQFSSNFRLSQYSYMCILYRTSHNKSMLSLQQPPKCNTCAEKHPNFIYKCKGRPTPKPENPGLVVPIRTPETNTLIPRITSMTQPISTSQFLTFITVTLQNLYPFQHQEVLHHLQFAARTILNTNLQATYSGPYVFVHTNILEREV